MNSIFNFRRTNQASRRSLSRSQPFLFQDLALPEPFSFTFYHGSTQLVALLRHQEYSAACCARSPVHSGHCRVDCHRAAHRLAAFCTSNDRYVRQGQLCNILSAEFHVLLCIVTGRSLPFSATAHPELPDPGSLAPPSFEFAQFDIVLRRQRARGAPGAPKPGALPSRFLHLGNDFEFAGWGTISRIRFTQEELEAGRDKIADKHRTRTLGQSTASALAGNAVLGSVFYALPAVVLVSSV
jgi:hypothetical protein